MNVIAELSEAERNALLRRVDWRFLLPQARLSRTVVFTDDRLMHALALISDEVVTPERAEPDSCDLAVAVDPDEQTLARALAALRPGGILYSEWYRAGRRAAIRRRIRGARFEDDRAYFAWPPPRRAASGFWIPIDVPGPQRFFLATRPPGRGIGRGISALVRGAWRAALRVGVVRPVCVVARKPAPAETVVLGPVPEIGWDADQLGPLHRATEWLLMTGGRRSINKVAALGFAPGSDEPQVVVKLARVPESGRTLDAEAAALRALHDASAVAIPGTPRPLASSTTRGTSALGQSLVRGAPVYTQLTRNSYEGLAWGGTRWLAMLANSTAAVHPPGWRARLVDASMTRFEDMFGAVVKSELLEATRACLAKLPELPLVFEHRDFSPWNVLAMHDGEIGVLDWESAESSGLPLMDLVYFLTYMATFRDNTSAKSPRAAYAASLDPDTVTGRVTAACTDFYINSTGMPREAVNSLHLLTWMVHARSEFGAMQADPIGSPPESELRNGTFVGLWEEAAIRSRYA